MAFCAGGFPKVKKFLHQVTDVLEEIMVKITAVTAQIKAIEGDPTIDAIIKAVPIGSEIEGYLNTGLDTIAGVGNEVVTFAERLIAWLDGETKAAKDMKLAKLSQVSTAVADNNAHPQHFYDTVVQVHFEGLK